MQTSGIEITVPIGACKVSPLMATPYTTQGRIESLTQQLKASVALPRPVVRNLGQTFEVVFAWDVVEVLRDNNQETAKVLLIPDDLSTLLYWTIARQADYLGLSWVSVARALARAKEETGWTHRKLGDATGLTQSAVSRYLGIVRKLNPTLLNLAEAGKITYSDSRELIKLPATRQQALVVEFRERHWDNRKLMRKAFPGPATDLSVAQGNAAEESVAVPQFEKGSDIKRLEVQVSERLGYPFEIMPTSAGAKTGKLRYQFFDQASLVDLLEAMGGGYQGGVKPHGNIVVDYGSLDELESLIGGFLAEE